MGFEGGVYNPGAITYGDEVMVIARSEKLHWKKIVTGKRTFLRSYPPVLFWLTKTLDVKEAKKTSFLNYPPLGSFRAEDFRMFKFKEHIYISHLMVDDLRVPRPTMKGKQALAELDPEHCRLRYVGYPVLDFATSRVERNWGFFEHNEDLYLIYSFSPYILLRLADWEHLLFKTIVNKEMTINIESLNNYSRHMTSFSTPPIHYDDKHYIVFVHKRDDNHVRYAQWAVLLDKITLLPVKMTSLPVLQGIRDKKFEKNVVNIVGIISQENDFVLFQGEDDLYSSYIRVPKKTLENSFVSIK